MQGTSATVFNETYIDSSYSKPYTALFFLQTNPRCPLKTRVDWPAHRAWHADDRTKTTPLPVIFSGRHTSERFFFAFRIYSGRGRARRHAPPGGRRREAAAVPVQDPRGVRGGPRQLPARAEKAPLPRGGRDRPGESS